MEVIWVILESAGADGASGEGTGTAGRKVKRVFIVTGQVNRGQGSGARGRTRAVVIKEGAAGRSKGQNQRDLVANCKWGVRYSQR